MWPGIAAGITIGLIAFVLSFDALRLVFVACGINPRLSWGGPVCVEGTILLCTLATGGFKKGHIRGSVYPWIGLVLFSGFSIAGNALHAMLSTGYNLPSWVPPLIMSIPPVALLYATHLIVIIAGDRLDKINTTVDATAHEQIEEGAEQSTSQTTARTTPEPEPHPATPASIPELPDLYDWRIPVPDTEDDARPKADEAEAPAADASTSIEPTSVQPTQNKPASIPDSTAQSPDTREQADAIETQAVEPARPTTSETAPTPADINETGNDDDAWLAWLDELKRRGETPSARGAIDTGLAANGSIAKRQLARFRREHPGRF